MDYVSFLQFLEKRFPVARFKLIEKPIEIDKPHYLKINSMEHKSDIGGVVKVIDTADLVEKFEKLKKIANPPFILQEEAQGKEFIIGLFKDKTFGDIIMFGGGGILTELYKDVSFRRCPISRRDVIEMIKETKVGELFEGYSGNKLNLEKTVKLLIEISKLPKEIEFKSIDFNPVIINEKEVKIVDARLIQ
jgi:hypothetical protein